MLMLKCLNFKKILILKSVKFVFICVTLLNILKKYKTKIMKNFSKINYFFYWMNIMIFIVSKESHINIVDPMVIFPEISPSAN